MRTHHTHLTQAELTLLEEQYWTSPYGQRQLTKQLNNRADSPPKKVAIFDFDSTLFLSPLFSSNLWDHWLVNAVTTENLFGPGFWRDIRSLTLDDIDGKATESHTDNLVASGWNGWWNEDVVKEARRAIEDPTVLTVVLTGRRVHPFGGLIQQMLLTKGLNFDILGLRPDPSLPTTNKHPLGFNEIPDTFLTTMDFKACFILHLRSKVDSLRDIIMWDDRPSHLPVLRQFVAGLIEQGYFEHGSVESVVAVRPKYNPKWEMGLVETILESHNQALGHAGNRSVAPVSVVIDNKGNSVDSYDPVQLVRRPYNPMPFGDHTVLRLTSSSVDMVRDVFGPLYQHHHQELELLQPAWQYIYGEQPVFFGDIVFDTSGSILQQLVTTMDSTDQLTLVVIGWDTGRTGPNQVDIPTIPVDHGLTLLVRIEGSVDNKEHLILPLWYRPSTFQKLCTQPYQWTQASEKYDGLRLTAHLDSMYLYGIEKKVTL